MAELEQDLFNQYLSQFSDPSALNQGRIGQIDTQRQNVKNALAKSQQRGLGEKVGGVALPLANALGFILDATSGDESRRSQATGKLLRNRQLFKEQLKEKKTEREGTLDKTLKELGLLSGFDAQEFGVKSDAIRRKNVRVGQAQTKAEQAKARAQSQKNFETTNKRLSDSLSASEKKEQEGKQAVAIADAGGTLNSEQQIAYKKYTGKTWVTKEQGAELVRNDLRDNFEGFYGKTLRKQLQEEGLSIQETEAQIDRAFEQWILTQPKFKESAELSDQLLQAAQFGALPSSTPRTGGESIESLTDPLRASNQQTLADKALEVFSRDPKTITSPFGQRPKGFGARRKQDEELSLEEQILRLAGAMGK